MQKPHPSCGTKLGRRSIRGIFYINIAAIILSILIDIAIADSKNQIKKWLRSCYYSKSNSRTLSEFKLYYKRGSRD
ncbi:hypothetical protein VQ643_08675, partial [Pseudomonas sp. F1_0610]|uniref:hypothetical protein n=1 Tax=Pseudomonas sp. F1_0610 TaxID=3114284 RepID=UPI0039C3A535